MQQHDHAPERAPRYLPDWPLPALGYLPGVNKRPAEVQAPTDHGGTEFDEHTWRKSAHFLHGVDLFNGGFFWEAHEAWEHVWLPLPRGCQPRSLLQGLIQVAAAHLKLRLGQPDAARALQDRARSHLARVHGRLDAGGRYLGVDVRHCERELEDALAAGAPGRQPQIFLEFGARP